MKAAGVYSPRGCYNPSPMDYAALMVRAEEFYEEMALEYFNHFAGLSEDFRLVEIVGRYPELFSRETYNAAMATVPPGVGDRELRLLRNFLTGNLFTAELKGLVEKKEKKEAALTVRQGGREIPYRALPPTVANEPDARVRRELDAAGVAALDLEVNPLYRRIFEETIRLTQELGYSSYTEMVRTLTGIPLEQLHQHLLAFLDESEDLYFDALEEYAGSLLGLGLDELEQCDAGYLFRADRFDGLFPAEKMVGALRETLLGLGIDLDAQENVTLDLESRPRKTPRAFCIGVRVPEDVRLVISPQGGVQDYQALFHEAGHLEFSAHMSARLPFLFRQEGDTTVHESYAFLMQYLTTDQVWLSEMLGAEDTEEFLRFSRFHKLYMLRRYAAKLDYEFTFWPRPKLDAAGELYTDRLTRAVGFKYRPERALADFDENYYVAKYLQAWMAEAAVRCHLKLDYGEDWFLNPDAGDWLRELWRDGMKHDIRELMAMNNWPDLNYRPMLDDIADWLA